jgi:hypothetical protein
MKKYENPENAIIYPKPHLQVIPEGADVIQHANCYFQEIEVDGFPRVYVLTDHTVIRPKTLIHKSTNLKPQTFHPMIVGIPTGTELLADPNPRPQILNPEP